MSTSEIERLLAIGEKPLPVHPGLAAGYLPSFGDVVAVTTNKAAVMMTTGAYESSGFARMVNYAQRGLRVCFNYDRTARVALAAEDAQQQVPVIRFIDDNDGIGHTTYLTDPSDRWALECLALSARSLKPQARPDEPSPASVIGFHRRDEPRAQIDRQVIPHLLAYLANLRLPLTMALSNRSCIQCDDGAVESLARSGDCLSIRMGRSSLTFDPAAIGSWRSHEVPVENGQLILEALAPDGGPVLHLTCRGQSCESVCESWKAIIASLPKVEAARG